MRFGLQKYILQETKENFVFPDKLVFAQLNTNAIDLERNWTKSAKHFSYFDWNSAKKLQKSFLFTLEKQSKRPLRFGFPLEGKCINWKKLNMWTF